MVVQHDLFYFYLQVTTDMFRSKAKEKLDGRSAREINGLAFSETLHYSIIDDRNGRRPRAALAGIQHVLIVTVSYKLFIDCGFFPALVASVLGIIITVYLSASKVRVIQLVFHHHHDAFHEGFYSYSELPHSV